MIHGDSKTRLYRIWTGIKTRCYDINYHAYPRYGGRGITECDEWREDYLKFKEWSLAHGYTDNLMLDRIDNNGNYCPENCRWVTNKVNCRNTRKCHYITYNGETHCIAEWAEILGISKTTLQSRIDRGMPVELAFTPDKIHRRFSKNLLTNSKRVV